MKCLLVVREYPSLDTRGEDLRIELEARGHAVRMVGYRRQNLLYKQKGLKALYQTWIRRRLLDLARGWRPDLVLVFKGETLGPECVREAKRLSGALWVNLFPDNPLLMIPFDQIEPYDLFCTKDRYALEALRRAGLRNLHYLPHHCSPALHRPVELSPGECEEFAAPVAFVGNHYPYRERFFAELADLPIAIWGKGWENAVPPVRRLARGREVRGREKLLAVSGAQISLNLHHPLNDIVSVNDRCFELAGARAFQLVDWKEDLGRFFKIGEEVVTFRDAGECRRLVEYYLAHTEERVAIAARAQARAYRDHTSARRLDELLEALGPRMGR